MGRYAQRRRSGGGPPGAPPLIEMILATVDGTEVAVDYSGPVTAGDFELTDFLFADGAVNPTVIAQSDTEQLSLTTAAPISADTDLTYSGDAPGILTPQTITLTAA
jgi:hypothetical protein